MDLNHRWNWDKKEVQKINIPYENCLVFKILLDTSKFILQIEYNASTTEFRKSRNFCPKASLKFSKRVQYLFLIEISHFMNFDSLKNFSALCYRIMHYVPHWKALILDFLMHNEVVALLESVWPSWKRLGYSYFMTCLICL